MTEIQDDEAVKQNCFDHLDCKEFDNERDKKGVMKAGREVFAHTALLTPGMENCALADAFDVAKWPPE